MDAKLMDIMSRGEVFVLHSQSGPQAGNVCFLVGVLFFQLQWLQSLGPVGVAGQSR